MSRHFANQFGGRYFFGIVRGDMATIAQNRDAIRDAYHTGRGRIIMRAAVQKETRRGGKEQLVVTALPYAVSKAKVIEQIATAAYRAS